MRLWMDVELWWLSSSFHHAHASQFSFSFAGNVVVSTLQKPNPPHLPGLGIPEDKVWLVWADL